MSKCLVFWQGGSWELRVELTVSSPRCRRLFQGIALTRLCPTCVVHLSYHILTIQKGLFYWILFVSNIWTQGSVQRLIFKKKVPDDKRPHLNRPFLWNYTWKPIGKILTQNQFSFRLSLSWSFCFLTWANLCCRSRVGWQCLPRIGHICPRHRLQHCRAP